MQRKGIGYEVVPSLWDNFPVIMGQAARYSLLPKTSELLGRKPLARSRAGSEGGGGDDAFARLKPQTERAERNGGLCLKAYLCRRYKITKDDNSRALSRH